MNITADFEGGNIRLISIQDNIVNLEQQLKGTNGWWFYWFFKVENANSGKYTFKFHNKEVVCPNGPATSTDRINWSWHKDGFVDNSTFTYTFFEGESRYFCFTIPYTKIDLDRFLNTVSNVSSFILCKSEDGRKVTALTFGNGKKDVFFTARHHACESTASFVLEGIIKYALNDPYFFDNFKFHVFPFVDFDGVVKGEQGKDRVPHDHNRDYIDNPVYAFTRAIKEYAKNTEPIFYIDLHSPWKWGGDNDYPHIFLSADIEPCPEMQYFFSDALLKLSKNTAVQFRGRLNPHTPEKCTSAKYFFKSDCKALLSITVETPYSGPEGYTVAHLHEWGQNIAKALKITGEKYEI